MPLPLLRGAWVRVLEVEVSFQLFQFWKQLNRRKVLRLFATGNYSVPSGCGW